MTNNLTSQLRAIANHCLCDNKEEHHRVLARIKQGKLTRDEDKSTHFCVYFLPHNPETKKVFIVHHKKSGLWLSPGGHIDKGETLIEALNREIEEELGVAKNFNNKEKPFMLSITDIPSPLQSCNVHYDIWYLMQTNGKEFNIDPREFYATRWLSFKQARELVTDPNNIRALGVVEEKFDDEIKKRQQNVLLP